MGAKTSISWTERTWNYFRGCSEKSAGCNQCYARLMAARFSGAGQPYEGIAFMNKGGKPQWTKKIAVVPEHMNDPLQWQRPSLIFVNSMSDLFHEDAELNAIINSYEVMMKANWHIYQPLTKRPELMPTVLAKITLSNGQNMATNPLPHVWHGTSIENEKTAEERSELLAATPSVIRWISAEPLITNINWMKWLPISKANWVVFGGESLQGESDGCREMKLEWLREGLAACKQLKISAFVKQLGYWYAKKHTRAEKFAADPAGKKPDCWPEDVRVQNYPVDLDTALDKTRKPQRVGKVIPLEVLSVV